MKNIISRVEADLKRVLYVPVDVELGDKCPNACIDFRENKVYVNQSGVESFANRGMDIKRVVTAFLQHEFSHKAFHPYDLKRIVAMDIALSKYNITPRKKEYILQRFSDMAANLKFWDVNDGFELKEWYRLSEDKSDFDTIEKMFYTDLCRHDFGKYDKKLEQHLKKLYSIDFFSGNPVKSVKDCMDQAKRFYFAVNSLIPDEPEDMSRSDITKAGDMKYEEVEGIVKELIAGGDIDPEDGKKYLEHNISEKGKMWGDSFNQSPEVTASFVVYDVLSDKYPLKIIQIPVKENGGEYPHLYERWDVTDPVSDVDVFASFGRVGLPGLTKKAVKKPVKIYGKRKKVNDAIIALDDSGSMVNPVKNISYAVASSFAAAKCYVRNGSAVAPIEFSDRTTRENFMRDERQILYELLKFKCGWSTYIELENIECVVKGNMRKKEELDGIIISDGAIENRSEVIEYFSDFGKAYMFEIGGSGEKHKEGNVVVCPVNSEADIGKIIIGEMI